MTHILGDHAQLVITTAHDCRPSTHTPDQANALMQAVLHCIDLAGGVTQASPPRFDTSPDKPALSNRTRSSTRQPAPMNPVHRHHGVGESGRPPSDRDAAYWQHEYGRVSSHFDRCEVVRRAAEYLARLIARDPNATTGTYTDKDLDEDIRVLGKGWPPADVARKFHVDERRVVLARLDHDLHPLTGQPWTPPEINTFAAQAARDMRDHGMNSTDIGRALERNASTVREWTTRRRQAA